ncbi:MAG: hypothetical protein CVU05_05865 [Bacteroidetes bacterium HGW-Bacteroidetes-21]|jgi:uncharacterized protein (TIGR02145 family)|nr:MAG: hypothetical protein CVU05_05865 [Bacteroidetes bacterium HGW-Bacteroidetes-21]
MKTTLTLIALFCGLIMTAQTVTDFDGNVYETITIQDQVWLKQNLKSLHYTDGTEIPGVCAYNNNDSLASVLGELYTWDAVMKGSQLEEVQGVCPSGFHVPSSAEWEILEYSLGGPSVAGGKLKSVNMWNAPNCGADNSSGFSALPSGEFDTYQSGAFQFLNAYASFWTSTFAGGQFAVERYLSYENCESTTNNWYKDMKYAVRCIKDDQAGIAENNPFDDYKIFAGEKEGSIVVIIPQNASPEVTVSVYDLAGRQVYTDILPQSGTHIIQCPHSGLYLIDLTRKTERKGQKLQTR